MVRNPHATGMTTAHVRCTHVCAVSCCSAGSLQDIVDNPSHPADLVHILHGMVSCIQSHVFIHIALVYSIAACYL